MANPVLFKSSILLTIFHIIIVEAWNVPHLFRVYIWLGCLSSIWNHGTTSNLAQFFDRIFMIVFTSMNFIYITGFEEEHLLLKLIGVFAILGGGACFLTAKFLIAKQNNENSHGNKYHLITHGIGTFVNFIISYYFHAIKV